MYVGDETVEATVNTAVLPVVVQMFVATGAVVMDTELTVIDAEALAVQLFPSV